MFRKLIRREVRNEIREGFTELVLAGIDSRVSGADVDPLVTGAVETCAGIWGRVLAAARVEGTDALTGRVRHRIGRDLIRVGESVFEIMVNGSSPMLEPAVEWDVLEEWRYRLGFQLPKGKLVQRTVPRGRVTHFMWTQSVREPWRGQSPLEVATGLGRLTARTEKALSRDVNTPTAHLVPFPSDGSDETLSKLRERVGSAEGRAVLVESTHRGMGDGREWGTKDDWATRRLGPMVPTELRVLYSDILAAVAQACGIPASLVQYQNVDGTEVRESYRRFVLTSVQPVADLIAAEASEALDTDVTLSFHQLWAFDLQGRSTALGKLVEAGVPLEEARRLVGLE